MADREKRLIEAFNQHDSILVISSYPEKGIKYSGRVCAVGGFAKNTLEALKKEFRVRGETRKIIVLTVTTKGKPEIYEEKGILVIRVFKRNKPWSYLSLLRVLRELEKVRDVLVEFEFASFGNTLTTGLFPIFLGILGILGRRIVLVLHQVVFDLGQLSGHLGFKRTSFKSLVFEKLLRIFYWLLCLPAEKIIVLEKEFRKRLSGLVCPQKITVIPHGVDTSLKMVRKKLARKKLGIKGEEKVILYFGYLTWYKGVDQIVKIFNDQFSIFKQKRIKLIIAGGPSFTQNDKPHYQQFVKKVYQLAEKNNVEITGFLPERQIKDYFSAADLVILPYRVFMSSSGPLSLSLSFAKPFVLSRPLAKILETEDFGKGLKEAGLKKEDLVFELSGRSLAEKLSRFGRLKRKMAKLSQIMKEKRDFEVLSEKYVNLLLTQELSWKTRILPALGFSKAG